MSHPVTLKSGKTMSSILPRCKVLLYYNSKTSAKKGLPLPLGRGVCETKSKNGRARPRKPFISRVFCAQRGSETMVSEGARPWGRGRSGDCENQLYLILLLPYFLNDCFVGKYLQF